MESGDVRFLLGGVLIGLSVAAPIGPVNLEMIHRGIRQGFRAAFLVGLGSTLADLPYIAIAYAGADPLSRVAWARALAFGVGAIVLTYLGAGAIRAALTSGENLGGREDASPTRMAGGPFTTGFCITLFNPMTIAFWLGILSAALAARARERTMVEIAFVGSLLAGCLLWVLSLAGALHYGRHLARGPALRLISTAAGLSLIGYGVHFGLKALGAT